MEGGLEWIPTQVVGQSFLLHQIRKMTSLAIDVARGCASLETIQQALSPTNEHEFKFGSCTRIVFRHEYI